MGLSISLVLVSLAGPSLMAAASLPAADAPSIPSLLVRGDLGEVALELP